MAIVRDRPTLMAYGALGQLGYALNGLGPILPDLQRDLSLTRAEVALYPGLFALGAVVVGLFGPRSLRSFGRARSFRVATAAFTLAAAGMALAPGRVTTSLAAALLGFSGAVMLIVVNAVLTDIHGLNSSAALAEANGVSSSAAIAAPLFIAAGVGAGLGWQIGFAAVPVVIGVALLATKAHIPPPRVTSNRLPPGKVRRWVGMVLVVSIEFAFVFWATDYLRTQSDVGPSLAAVATSAFLVGMAVSRSLGGRLGNWLSNVRRASLVLLALVSAGFVLFWSSAWTGSTVLGFTGLLIAGTGVGPLYPLAMSSLASASAGATDLAAARAAVASGVAIGVTPLILGALADQLGLRPALLMIPLLAVAAAVEVWTRRPPVDSPAAAPGGG